MGIATIQTTRLKCLLIPELASHQFYNESYCFIFLKHILLYPTIKINAHVRLKHFGIMVPGQSSDIGFLISMVVLVAHNSMLHNIASHQRYRYSCLLPVSVDFRGNSQIQFHRRIHRVCGLCVCVGGVSL